MLRWIRLFFRRFDLNGRARLERVFTGRDALSAEDFFDRYFQDQGYARDLVERIRKVYETNLNFDLSRLSAEDDFSEELRFIWQYDSMADVEIVMGLEKEFGITIRDDEAAQMKTIRQVVEYVDARLKADHKAGGEEKSA